MTIIVSTALSTIGTSTYGVLQSRIADDLNRTDLTTQIPQNILLAIEHYKNEATWFNETSQTLTATVGQAYVNPPTDLLAIEDLYITISGIDIRLVPQERNDVIEFRPTSNGRPLAYCFYQGRFELDRKPDTAYSLPLYYRAQLLALSGTSDANIWTTDCEDLIVFHAEKMLYANVVKDFEKATAAGAQEAAALTRLRSLNISRTMTGYTKPVYL